MTKLSGTSGQHFAGLADAISMRGMARSAKSPDKSSDKSSAGPGTDDSSFHNLLNTVSNMAKRALGDQQDAGAVKSGAPRVRLVQAEERKDDTVGGDARATEDVDTPNKPAPIDHAAKLDIEMRLTLPSIVGQELAAVPALRQEPQPVSGETKGVATRTERAIRGSDVALKTAAATPELGTDPSSVIASQDATASQGAAAASKPLPAGTGFGAIAANVEHAAKFAGREALPETTKVSVLQQETHLPPVPQFSPTQQVANAVVTELKGSPAPASSAAADLTASQGNAPDQPLKVLTISLDPPALGNVTVRLRLAGDAVSVHLAAERKDTSQLLDQQRDSIRELMHSAGYVADVAPVQHGALDGSQTGQGQSQPSFSGQHQSSDARGMSDNSGTSSGQSEGGTRRPRQDRNPGQETRHEQDLASANRRGPVYL